MAIIERSNSPSLPTAKNYGLALFFAFLIIVLGYVIIWLGHASPTLTDEKIFGVFGVGIVLAATVGKMGPFWGGVIVEYDKWTYWSLNAIGTFLLSLGLFQS
jgi:hypothetical protein